MSWKLYSIIQSELLQSRYHVSFISGIKMKIIAYIDWVLTCSITSNPLTNCLSYILLLSPFFRQQNWVRKGISLNLWHRAFGQWLTDREPAQPSCSCLGFRLSDMLFNRTARQNRRGTERGRHPLQSTWWIFYSPHKANCEKQMKCLKRAMAFMSQFCEQLLTDLWYYFNYAEGRIF